jgi:diaminohydroxyphosphoribosylaminopyrimidine deaminase / 5-amino-6-(5-phosphoribosylamino)uracil reductase
VNAEVDRRYMRRALQLAARAAGETNPNPMVGCVIVKGGRIVGEGYHHRAGQAHAEVLALRAAGDRTRGATMYVTLEPCSLTARTPPCAPDVRDAGIRRVVVAMRDPNALVNGRGFRILRRGGIAVTVGVLEAEAARLNERFALAQIHRRPYVLLKVATTLDGRIATARGESKWITSPDQRRAARRLRRVHDAVLVGIGTILVDDPTLLPEPAVRRPFARVVLDTGLRLPVHSRLVRSAGKEAPVIVMGAAGNDARRQQLEARGVIVRCGPTRDGRVSLAWALKTLWQLEVASVMVEGGAEVLGAFLRDRLVDKVSLFRAPLLLGGRGSRAAFGGPDPLRLAQGLRMRRAEPSPVDRLELGGRPAALDVEHWYPDAGGHSHKTS